MTLTPPTMKNTQKIKDIFKSLKKELAKLTSAMSLKNNY